MQLTFILYHGAGASILLSNLYLHHHKILKRFVTLTNLIGAYLPPFNEEEKLKKKPKDRKLAVIIIMVFHTLLKYPPPPKGNKRFQ